MARLVRLVNCSLVFLLVIRCIRAPGQRPARLKPSERASVARLARLLSAPGIITASASAVICSLPETILRPQLPTTRCTAPVELRIARIYTYAHVYAWARAWTFLRAPGGNVPGHDRTIGADVLTEHAAGKRANRWAAPPPGVPRHITRNRSESRNKPERALLNPSMRCTLAVDCCVKTWWAQLVPRGLHRQGNPVPYFLSV